MEETNKRKDQNRFSMDNGIREKLNQKPPLTIDEMITRIQEHVKYETNLTDYQMTSFEIENAKIILREINYYRLSIFLRFAIEENKGFDRAIKLYDFDRFLRNLLIQLLNPIEELLKTTLAYYLAHHYPFHKELTSYPSSLVYLDPDIYKEKMIFNKEKNEYESTYKRLVREFNLSIKRNFSQEKSLNHYQQNYGGYFPIWILVEHLTFGNLSHFVSSLKTSIVKGWIKESFPVSDKKSIGSPRQIVEWINTLREIRNICAHMARLYHRKFTFAPNIKALVKDDMKIEEEKIKHTLLGALLVMRQFYTILSSNRIEEWNHFVKELETKIIDLKINPQFIGFIGDVDCPSSLSCDDLKIKV